MHLYREGIVRSSSQPHGFGERSAYLTNTAVNRKKKTEGRADDRGEEEEDLDEDEDEAGIDGEPGADMVFPEQPPVTMAFSDLNPRLAGMGIDTSKMWADVQHTVVVAFIACLGELYDGELESPYDRSRAYQVFGADVIIGEDMRPYILEINARPTMASPLKSLVKMKMKMIKDAQEIALPHPELQRVVDEYRRTYLLPAGNRAKRVMKTVGAFAQFLDAHPEVKPLTRPIPRSRQNGWTRVYPCMPGFDSARVAAYERMIEWAVERRREGHAAAFGRDHLPIE